MDNKGNNTTNLNSLDEFQGWDDMASEQDFFSNDLQDQDSTDVNDVMQQVSKDAISNDSDDNDDLDEDKKNEQKEQSLFDAQDDDEDNDSNDLSDLNEDGGEDREEDEEDDSLTNSPNISTLNFLKDKGYIDFELEEDEELTEEKAEELIEDKFDEAIETRIEELFGSLPDVVKQINKYAIEGGDVNAFFNNMAKSSSVKITADLDIEEESNQELVTREILEQEGYDSDYIDTQIEFLKDSGKLKMFSEKKFNKWKTTNKAQQEALVKSQEEFNKKQKQSIREAKKKISSFISENEEVGGITFNKKDKKDLPSYMNDRTIKLQNGNTISQMQKELFYDLPKNEEAFMQLAVLIKNRNEDGTFNFDSIIKNTETKVVKKVKDNVRRSKTSIPNKSKNSRKSSNRSLADFFNN